MHNPGGIRASLNAGQVNYNDLFRVLPFGNMLVRVTLSGRALREVVERGAARYYFSGFTMLTELPTEHMGTQLDAFIDYLRALPQPVVAPAEPRIRRTR
jgi:2',3'-cyclic-nucleotide 2'-phosphodiesterase (5'-nucleotidase family)